MRVLIVWEEVPERTKLYIAEGDMVQTAIDSAGYFINGEENDAIIRLSEWLESQEPIGHESCKESFPVCAINYVVICGMIM